MENIMTEQTNSVTPEQSKVRTLITNKYVLIAAGCILLLTAVAIILSFFAPSQTKKVAKAPTKTLPNTMSTITPPVTKYQDDPYEEQTAKDSGYVPFSEGSHLAEESEKELLADGSTKYTMESENPNRSDIMIVKNGALIFARHAVVGAEISDGYRNLLGKQSHTISESTFYGPETLVYFYEEGGTALIVNPRTGTTYEEFTFQPPISLEEFNSTYKQYVR